MVFKFLQYKDLKKVVLKFYFKVDFDKWFN